jgi:hypothetical protein
MGFKKASKLESKARIALCGPSGSGKSLSALLIASGLGTRIAALDTEHGSLAKYSDRVNFDVDELTSFDPKVCIAGIREAENAGYEVLVIDSLSHFWAGKDGILQQVDRIAAKSKSGSTFDAWRDPSALHTELIEALHTAKVHLVTTMRSKTAYVLEANDRGKMVPKKVGLEPVQRDGMEFEFDVVGELDLDHRLTITKSRYEGFDGATFDKAGADFGRQLLGWLAGEKRREPWETETFALGEEERLGTLVCEAPPHVVSKYLEVVEQHVKRHPELPRAEKDGWRKHYALCKQAHEHAVKRENEQQQAGPDGWGLSQGGQA